MAEQKIRRSRSGQYDTTGRRRQRRAIVQKRRLFSQARERGALRLLDLVRLSEVDHAAS